MRQIVQNTTQKLIDLLPESEQYYRLDELRSWGFPSFIVQRIKVELERNMADSMLIPKTDWANTNSDAVQHAWKKFVQAIRAEARLPASYARAVIETAVVDVLDMLTEPVKNIPDVIFGGDEELDFEELIDRVEAVVVYPHFSALIPRYMQKKNRDSLSKKQCIQLIKRADKKLTDNYSPLNWAQTLAPLFTLLDGSIEPGLLRLFFEDKNKKKIAEVFDRRDEALNRAEFIEVLSSPDLLDTAPAYVEQEVDQPSTEEKSEGTIEDDKEEPEEVDNRAQNALKEQSEEEPPRFSGDDNNDAFQDEPPSPKNFDDEEDHEIEDPADEQSAEESGSMNNSFAPVDLTADSEAKGSDSINYAFLEQEEEPERTSAAEQENNTKKQNEAERQSSAKVHDSEEEEVDPMWMHFMNEEDKDALEAGEESEETFPVNLEETDEKEKVDEDGFIDEPIIDLTEDETSGREIEKIKEQLSGQEDYFIEDIFGGSEQAYQQAIEGIALFDDWQSASKYIQNEVFKRNFVNMYSESAVDFTDRLQSYFLEKEKTDK